MDNDIRLLVNDILKHHDTSALEKLKNLFPESWFEFQAHAGLIVWWPHDDFGITHTIIPYAINHMASNIYLFNQVDCFVLKNRNGINFPIPKEVLVLQVMLS